MKCKLLLGGGRNVDDQNVDRSKISERRNGLFSWSERRNQNVENVFWVDQNYDDQNVENSINKNCLGSFQVLWNKNCTTENEEIMMEKLI